MPESKIYNIDCLAAMREMPDKAFSLAIVDPPYGIGVSISMGRRRGGKKSSYHKFFGGDNSIPDSEYFYNLLRVSENQIIWGGNYMTDFLRPSPCWIIWDKGFSQDVTFAQIEMAWSSFSSSAKKFNKSPNQQGRIHPTQKPIALYKWLLQNYAKPGDSILDTHLGSGSSRIAAYDMGFDFTGYELDAEYFNASNVRFKNHISNLKLFAPDEMYRPEQARMF